MDVACDRLALPAGRTQLSAQQAAGRRHRRWRHLAFGAIAFLGLQGVPVALASATTSAASPPIVARASTQALVTLLASHEAFSSPDSTSSTMQLIQATRPLTGERTVLPVLGTQRSRNGIDWLEVMLPGRPNSRTGWITGDHTEDSSTAFSVVVDLSARTLAVYQAGRIARSVSVVVGKPSTPTPLGRFFVEEVVKLPSTAVGAPYAFALSARSNVLQEFDGGPGQIALHGLGNIGGVAGTAVSHGCVRVDTATLQWMVTRVGPGVVVTVKA